MYRGAICPMSDIVIRQMRLDDARGVMDLISDAGPYVRVRSESDYWSYAMFFSNTCKVATVNDEIVGVIIAYMNQADWQELYIQDLVVSGKWRKQNVGRRLVIAVEETFQKRHGRKIWLLCNPDNFAVAVWQRLGYRIREGDTTINGISIHENFRGLGKHRVILEKYVRS